MKRIQKIFVIVVVLLAFFVIGLFCLVWFYKYSAGVDMSVRSHNAQIQLDIRTIASQLVKYTQDHQQIFPIELKAGQSVQLCTRAQSECGDMVSLSFLIGDYLTKVPADTWHPCFIKKITNRTSEAEAERISNLRKRCEGIILDTGYWLFDEGDKWSLRGDCEELDYCYADILKNDFSITSGVLR